MSGIAPKAAPRGYLSALALRHLWRGAYAPRDSMREALRARIGEPARLLLLALFALALGLLDPDTRALGRAALENAVDDDSRMRGLLLLALGAAVIGVGIVIAYLVAALIAHALSWPAWSRASFARARSVAALSAWFSLLPTVVVKGLALALLPAAMIAADPPSLFSAIEIVMLIPFFAACLMAAFGAGPVRALLVATLINGAFYLALVFLYLVSPSP